MDGRQCSLILADPFHEVTSLRKQGSVPIGEKLVKKKVES